MAVVVGHLHTDSIGVRRAASRCMQLQKFERFQAYCAKKRDLLGSPAFKEKQAKARRIRYANQKDGPCRPYVYKKNS